MSPVRFGSLLLALVLAVPHARAQDIAPVAIRNARIVPVSGVPIEAGTIVLADGLIRAVGTRVDVPPEAVVIDGVGLTVYPGLIDALTDLGVGSTTSNGAQQPGTRAGARPARGPGDRPGSSPWVQAADEFSPDAQRLETWRQAGFTSVVAAPSGGILPGQAAVVNLSGAERGESVVRAAVALPVRLRPPAAASSFPGSLMGVVAYVRQVFLDTRHYGTLAGAYAANPKGRARPEYDRTVTTLHDVLLAKTPVLLPATTAAEIDRVLRFGRELDVPFVVYGGHDAARAATRLAQERTSVILSARWPEKARNADPEAREPLRVLELRDRAPGAAAALAAQNVRFAFYSDGLPGPKELLANVRMAIDAGLTREAALRALTLDPAQIYGVADRLGSLEAGKIANLVVVSGELFDPGATVRHVFIDGQRFDVPDEPAHAAPGSAPTRGRATRVAVLEGERR